MNFPRVAWSFPSVLLALASTGCGASQMGTAPGQVPASLDRDVVRVERESANVVTAADLARYPTGITLEAILEQQVPGMRLRGRHEPGGAMTMHLQGSANPLIVVDGVPMDAHIGNIGLNPRDIQRIEVRKYGNTAEYGLRGSNGVILISTRR